MPLTIKLSKSDSGIPWGFRLHGGKDFGAPLTVQRINPSSIASKCGLQIGDNISVINSQPTNGLKHKEAQDLIVKAGNDIQLTICRGGEIPMRRADVEIFTPEPYEKPSLRVGEVAVYPENNFTSQLDSLSLGDNNKPRLPSYSSAPYKAPPATSISSKNASLYHPSLQTPVTGGLTKSADRNSDDFPPPPSSLPLPFSTNSSSFPSANATKSHQPVHRFPDVTVTEGASVKIGDSSKYVPSETYKLVKDIEAGLDVPFNPKTGAPTARSSAIQSKLVDILEKKHATIENDKLQEMAKRSTSPQPPYFGPKSSNYGVAIGGAAFNREGPQKFGGSNFPTQMGHAPSPLNPPSKTIVDRLDPSAVPICNVCKTPVRGAYVMAINKVWCPEHFVCSQPGCKKNLSDIGFVEEQGQVYCKDDYEKYLAPRCAKCQKGIIGNTVKALKSTFHPECFTCVQCNQAIMGGSFHLHEGQVYCDRDFSDMFSARCQGCNFPIEVGDNWIEAVGTNWHGECFNCSVCQLNLQNSGFIHKNGRFVCRDHAR